MIDRCGGGDFWFISYLRVDFVLILSFARRLPAIPPPDNSLKWKDYVLIFSALILIGFLTAWVLWRLWLPIRAIRREKRRLRVKFAPQDEDASAILRPETLHTQTAAHVKLVCAA